MGLSTGLTENVASLHVSLALQMPSTDLLALIVPLVILVVAIRRNTGVLAAILLLMLFIVTL
jgi:hypothetical protein